jgi:phage terminase large subunit-like protein
LHERARRILDGESEDETLLPVICEAPKELDWTSEEAARAANPSLGQIITFDQLRPQLLKAKENAAAESSYRRLYLSQWVAGANKWLDLTQWDSCTADPDPPKDAPLYVGVDLSQGDDLCAAVFVWTTAGRFYVRSHFWLPQETAKRYQEKEGIPYKEWADAGGLTLLAQPTIDLAATDAIAAHIVAAAKGFKCKAVTYDPYRADACITALETAGLTCVPIAQGFSVSQGCQELARRLKEGSIAIAPNPVLRACAENVEVKRDDRGNYWPAKPGAKGAYAGKRGAKIDGIAALVTALTEARKQAFETVKKQWRGNVLTI